MICTFFDQQDRSNPWNGTRVADRGQFVEIMESWSGRPPFMCELIGENGYDLVFGVGPSLGCAQYGRHDGEPPFLMATVRGEGHDAEDMDFLMGGTPTPVPLRECLPMDVITE